MTLTIIFGVLCIVAIGFMVLDHIACLYSEVLYGLSVAVLIAAAIALVINLCIWIPSSKNDEIEYQKFIIQKETIEIMLNTDKDIDRLLLNDRVISFNNDLIAKQQNSTRPIFNEYYSKNVNWHEIELIKWQ